MDKLASSHNVLEYDLSKDSYLNSLSGNYMDTFVSMFIRQGNQIAMTTRRGCTNVMIVSSYVHKEILEKYKPGYFESLDENKRKHKSHVGTFYNVDVYVSDLIDDVLLAYKASDVDSGIFYSPYIIDTEDDSIVLRDNIFTHSEQFYNSAAYYRKIKIIR